MRLIAAAGALAVAAASIGTAGCGASRPAERIGTPRAAPTEQRTSSRTAATLTRALLATDGLLSCRFPSFHAIETPTIVRAAGVWTADEGVPGAQGQLQADRLDRIGFVAAVRQSMYADERSSAQLTSIVEEFRSPAGARAELTYRRLQARAAAQLGGETYTPFHVSEIPDAVGYDTVIPGTIGYTAAFTVGPFYDQLEAIAPPSDPAAPSRTQIIGAVASLYQRVRVSLSV